MHETHFINDVFTVLRQEFAGKAAPGPVTVNVRLSPFSHVSAETLQGSFKELIQGEKFGDVTLNVLPLELPLECKDCGHKTLIAKKVFGCPSCGSANVSIQMDREFFVESLEVDRGQ